MSLLGERIRTLRKERGLTQAALAELVGLRQQSIQSIESGVVYRPRKLFEISIALGTSEAFLLGEASDPSPPLQPITISAEGPEPGGSKLPIIGGQPQAFQDRIWLSEKVGEVPTIPMLESVPGAFAVYVGGTSMEPRYFPGELIYVDPVRPPSRGDFVIVQIRRSSEDEAVSGFIRRFCGFEDTSVMLEQFNPRLEERFPPDVILIRGVIVGCTKP